jgi:outer membrane lipoprotein LolB
VAGLVLSLGGCTATTPPPAMSSALQSQLLALAHWRMEGRIGIKTSADAFQASLQWEHERNQDRVRVAGPFNQGGVSIVLQDDLILIRDNRGVLRTSRDAAGLLRQELGFAVPLASLRYWVIGIPEPASPGAPRYDDTGLLRQLRQDGWSLEYERFVPVQGFALPQKLSAQGAEMKLKLVVDDWKIFP